MRPSYAGIALLEVQSNQVAVSTLSVTTEACVLSGGWVLPISNNSDIRNVLAEKIALLANLNKETLALAKELNLKLVNFSDFLRDARLETIVALEQYEIFKAEQPAKRKKLVKPDFYEWPAQIDILHPKVELKKVKLQESILGTDPAMEQVLSAARLVKFYVDKWLSDESERCNRKFVQGEAKQSTPLPISWMN